MSSELKFNLYIENIQLMSVLPNNDFILMGDLPEYYVLIK